MKLRNIIVFTVITFTVLATSCSESMFDERLRGSGNVITENRTTANFTGIEVDGVFDVAVYLGNETEVIVEADDNLMQAIVTVVIGNKLYIDVDKDYKIRKSTRMIVHITTPDLNTIDFDGVGDIYSGNMLNFNSLDIEYDGVGDVDFEGNFGTIDIDADGTGAISLSGTATILDIDNSGVGSIKAENLEAKKGFIENSGVGHTKIFVTDELYLNVSGVGNVYYKGEPVIKELSVTGVGKVVKM